MTNPSNHRSHLEIGLEIGDQEPENGDWKPENGDRNPENGARMLEDGVRKPEMGTGSGKMDGVRVKTLGAHGLNICIEMSTPTRCRRAKGTLYV